MILTVDVGNSNTVSRAYRNGQKGKEFRFDTVKEDAYAYYVNEFKAMNLEQVDKIVVSCVVPRIENEIRKALFDVFGNQPLFINASTIKNFTIHLENPLEIGADFIATAFGAIANYPLPAIIADIGSATKLTVIDEDGSFKGGVILPGLGTSTDAMYRYIPHLPKVPLVLPETVIGTSTIGAIQSGFIYGLIAQIEALSDMLQDEMGVTCTKILTGGYANIIESVMADFVFDPDLLNDGLYEIVERGTYYE